MKEMVYNINKRQLCLYSRRIRGFEGSTQNENQQMCKFLCSNDSMCWKRVLFDQNYGPKVKLFKNRKGKCAA